MRTFRSKIRNIANFQISLVLIALLSGVSILTTTSVASAAALTSPSLALSDPRPSQTSVSYDFQASGVTLSSIRCIKLVFATTATGTTVPTAMTTTSATLSGSSNYVPTPASWAVDAATNGTVKITLAGGETPASASARNVIVAGITNGSTVGSTYFLQFSTFNNVDCATSSVDTTTIAYVYSNGQQVSMTVDPTISFTVAAVASAQAVNGATTTVTSTSTTLPFGVVTATTNAVAAQDLVVSTNATNGYTVSVRYTGQLTTGTFNIANHGGTNGTPTSFSAAGTAGFGYTTNDVTLGLATVNRFNSNLWAGLNTTNAEVAYSSAPVAAESTRVGYQVGISGVTGAGVYLTTVIYTATAIY